MTAIQALTEALKTIEEGQAECMQGGVVKTSHRYRYQELERKRRAMAESLEFMQGMTRAK
jgi:hypothetical protein